MRRWLRLSVPAILGAVALLGAASVAAATTTAVPRCDGVKLRTGPGTTYVTRLVIDRGDTVTVTADVKGQAWSTACGGRLYSGSKWATVTRVNGVSVQSRFGVDALYVAAGLLRTLSTATATPPAASPSAPTPSAKPSPVTTTGPPPASESPSSSTPVATSSLQPGPTATASPAVAGSPAGQQPAATNGASPIGAALPIVVVILAVVSVAMTAIAFRERRRRERIEHRQKLLTDVPPTRLEDILS